MRVIGFLVGLVLLGNIGTAFADDMVVVIEGVTIEECEVLVQGYERADGTYVDAHCRNLPQKPQAVALGEITDDTTIPPPPPAILQDPGHAVDMFKEIVNYLNPSYETVIDLWNGDIYQGISGSVYTVSSNNVNILSLRVGASTGMAVYGGVGLDVDGIVQRYLPQGAQDALSPPPTEPVWEFLGRYSHASVIAGYSWDHQDPVLGFTAGLKASF